MTDDNVAPIHGAQAPISTIPNEGAQLAEPAPLTATPAMAVAAAPMPPPPQALLIPADIAHALPAVVKAEVVHLSAERQAQFVEEYRRKARSLPVAYLLWFFGFLLGLHYLYLGKPAIWLAFMITFGGLGWWWLIDAFRMPGMTRDYNADVATAVMRDMKILAS